MEQAFVVVTSGKDLALQLTAAGRTRPAAVISWHPGQRENRIDVEHIAREIGDLADVFWLENGPESYAFGDSLPSGAHVFGNAARVYAEDLRWLTAVHRSPLRMARDREAAVRAAEDIIEDVLGLITVVPPKAPPGRTLPRRVRGTVKAFASAGSRAIVELGDGSCCTIQREHVVPPVRLDWMLDPGQSVEGDLNAEDRTLDINGLKTAPRLAELYRPGDLVLALAEQVSARNATLTLYPGSSWTVDQARISSNPLDTADSLVTEGEVVVTRFLRVNGAVVLSLLDVDDDADVVAAPALLAGGAPWLRSGRHLTEQPTSGRTFPAEAPSRPGPGTGGPGREGAGTGELGSASEAAGPAAKPSVALMTAQLQLEAERRKVSALQELVAAASHAGAGLVSLQQEQDVLRRELGTEQQIAQDARAALEHAEVRLARRNEELLDLRAYKRRTQPALKRALTAGSDALFATAGERVRHDVCLAWAKNVPASEKARQPLPPDWTAGPEFAASLYGFTEPGVQAKALKAVVEVLTGAAERNAAREVHALRATTGADTAQRVREDGSKCFRAAIEQSVASARRLHFWRLPDGSIELSRVVVHDDFKP
ncbi:hypothetical protein [Arthrobacter sp. AL12]|uniref:hypothetical protein n=1 Tax=Arthrobacter sp. AL12 TaxID=3042241 RepID=UPI00249A1FE8|nr:hypothetical protein [Arthrobacter sp. AL12]MDI3212178.1 hypothetical protein [Arthrobacter sp. AL12]